MTPAALLGFPNPVIGIHAFSVVVVTGILTLGAVALPVWYWISLAAGLSVGVVFVQRLIVASLYRLGALCPSLHGRVGRNDSSLAHSAGTGGCQRDVARVGLADRSDQVHRGDAAVHRAVWEYWRTLL